MRRISCRDHAAVLTRKAGPENLACDRVDRTVGEVEEQIIDCFHNGGGLPTGISPFPQGDGRGERRGVRRGACRIVLPLADGLVEQFGRHRCRRHRLRQRACHHVMAEAFGEQVHRLRLFRRGWPRTGGDAAAGPGRTRRSSSAMCPHSICRGVRRHRRVRRDPRPGEARPGSGEHLSGAAAGR